MLFFTACNCIKFRGVVYQIGIWVVIQYIEIIWAQLTKRPASLLWILTNVLISLRRRNRASRKSLDFRLPKFTLSSHPLHSQFSPTTGRGPSGMGGGAFLCDFLAFREFFPFLRGFLVRFLFLRLLPPPFRLPFALSKVVIWLLLFNRTLWCTRFLSHEHSTSSPIEQALAMVKAMPAAVIAFTNAVSRVSKGGRINFIRKFRKTVNYLSAESFSCCASATCSSICGDEIDSRTRESRGWCLSWSSSGATFYCGCPACRCRESCWESSASSCTPASDPVECCCLRPWNVCRWFS